MLYKAHLLSFLEYRTPAIYHATRDNLMRVDRIQSKFLGDAGVDEREALKYFNLAPLQTRRDMAMLGLLHRTVIGKGTPHFRQHFKLQPGRKVLDPRLEIKSPLVIRSALGLPAVYNMLSDRCREAKNVKEFQTRLQTLVKDRMEDGAPDWKDTFSPRLCLKTHPLRR